MLASGSERPLGGDENGTEDRGRTLVRLGVSSGETEETFWAVNNSRARAGRYAGGKRRSGRRAPGPPPAATDTAPSRARIVWMPSGLGCLAPCSRYGARGRGRRSWWSQ